MGQASRPTPHQTCCARGLIEPTAHSCFEHGTYKYRPWCGAHLAGSGPYHGPRGPRLAYAEKKEDSHSLAAARGCSEACRGGGGGGSAAAASWS